MRSVLNSKIYIGSMVDPAAEVDASSFAGADWVEIDGWTDRGPLGDVQAVGTQSRINRRRILKYKTTRSVNAMENQFVPLPLDPGQIRLKQAVASCRPYQFRIDTPGECGEEPEIEMFIGLALPGARQGGPTEAAHIRSWSIAPLSNIYEYPALFLNAIFSNNSALRSLRQNADATGPVHAPGTPIGLAIDQSGHGNDAVQVVGTARPLLRVFPRGGVRNLLSWSEDITNAAWTAVGATTPDFETLVPNNSAALGGTACFVQQSYAKPAVATQVTAQAELEAFGFDAVTVFIVGGATVNNRSQARVALTDGSVTSAYSAGTFSGDSHTIENLGSGRWKITLTCTTGTENTIKFRVIPVDSVETTGNGTDGIKVTKLQLNQGPVADYQRVTGPYDVTQSGVPDIYAPLFDGADDWLGNTLDAPVDISQTGAMIACVCQVSALGVSQSPIALANTTSTDGLLRFLVDSVGNASLNADPTDGSATVSPPFAGLESATELRILVGILQPDGTVRVRINGSEAVASAKVTSSIVVDRFSIGVTQRNTPITFFNGTIPESLFKIGTVSDAQIQQLERQWSQYYGVSLS